MYFGAKKVSEFDPIIVVIEEAYTVAHLDSTRKISALLPYDYHDSDKKYPVLYLQDGQNLFNPHAPFGDWAIDKSLSKLASEGFKDVIIIAIDHGEHERIREYLPDFHPKYGQGLGKHYIQFMKDKLIPYVNNKYRTLQDHENTGIGGSSMGGLISLFGGLTEPNIFGKMMIFSPSLWISNIIFENAMDFAPTQSSKIYLYAGGKESKSHLPNVLKMEKILLKKDISNDFFDLVVKINLEGEHGEIYWREEFPEAIKWLFYNKKI